MEVEFHAFLTKYYKKLKLYIYLSKKQDVAFRDGMEVPLCAFASWY
jgi:hypothetical protein